MVGGVRLLRAGGARAWSGGYGCSVLEGRARGRGGTAVACWRGVRVVGGVRL